MGQCESTVEDASLSRFIGGEYTCLHGPDMPLGKPAAERESCERLVLRAIRIKGRCEIVGRRSLDNIIHHRRSIA